MLRQFNLVTFEDVYKPGGEPDPVDYAMLSAADKLRGQLKRLEEEARNLGRAMSELAERVASQGANTSINSLGEVGNRGREIDRLCAEITSLKYSYEELERLKQSLYEQKLGVSKVQVRQLAERAVADPTLTVPILVEGKAAQLTGIAWGRTSGGRKDKTLVAARLDEKAVTYQASDYVKVLPEGVKL